MYLSSPNTLATPKRIPRGPAHPLMMAAAALLLLLQGCASTPPAPSPAESARAEAKAAYLANDYQRTLAIVEPLAIGGEAWAQYTLGYMYHYGRGVAMDRQKGKLWIQRAAEQGYGPAQQGLLRLSTSAPRPSPEEEENTPPIQPPAAAPGRAPMPTPPGTAKPDITTPPSEDMAPSEDNGPAAPPDAAPAPTPQAAPPTTAVPHKTPPASHADNGIKGRDWIAAQDPQHYTVQLVAAGDEAAVVRFIRNYHLEDQAAYYERSREGRPWYTVIYGSFAARQAARQALRRLPAAVGTASPWVRSFGEIQDRLGP